MLSALFEIVRKVDGRRGIAWAGAHWGCGCAYVQGKGSRCTCGGSGCMRASVSYACVRVLVCVRVCATVRVHVLSAFTSTYAGRRS